HDGVGLVARRGFDVVTLVHSNQREPLADSLVSPRHPGAVNVPATGTAAAALEVVQLQVDAEGMARQRDVDIAFQYPVLAVPGRPGHLGFLARLLVDDALQIL